MKNRKNKKPAIEFVELPTGIFTSSGIWFHTSEAALRDFGGKVIDIIGVEILLDQATVWARSPDGIAAFVFIASLNFIGPGMAVLLGLVAHYTWYTFLPVIVAPSITSSMRVLNAVTFQGIVFIVVLSLVASNGHFLAAGVGLVWFMLLRWGLVSSGVLAVSNLIGKPSLPKPDSILRSIIIRHALARNITLASTESFENRIREIWQRGKQK